MAAKRRRVDGSGDVDHRSAAARRAAGEAVKIIVESRFQSTEDWWKFGKFSHLGVFKNNGTPKWMIYNGKPY